MYPPQLVQICARFGLKFLNAHSPKMQPAVSPSFNSIRTQIRSLFQSSSYKKGARSLFLFLLLPFSKKVYLCFFFANLPEQALLPPEHMQKQSFHPPLLTTINLYYTCLLSIFFFIIFLIDVPFEFRQLQKIQSRQLS